MAAVKVMFIVMYAVRLYGMKNADMCGIKQNMAAVKCMLFGIMAWYKTQKYVMCTYAHLLCNNR